MSQNALLTSRRRSVTNFGRASVTGALVLAVAQMIDMRVTGRSASGTPVRAVEIVTRTRVRDPAARAAVGYAVQSFLAPVSAVAAQLAGPRTTQRLGAATLAPLVVVGVLNPSLGASAWPWRWTRNDWTRELTLKSVLAISVMVAL